ncbi:hypothetical protein OH77DRAFT_1507530 [Trametes cingulata]|nr:hypothetical protein OH77DRAFT_1507530 [Trametes cingulata]
MVPSTKDNMPAHLADAFPSPGGQFSPPRYVSPTVEDAPEEEQEEDTPGWRTQANEFGVFREYPERPTLDPELSKTLDEICDSPTLAKDAPAKQTPPKTIFWLTRHSAIGIAEDMSGIPGTGDRSLDDFDCLIDVLLSRGFSLEDLQGFRGQLAQRLLDEYVHPSGIFSAEDGWSEGSIKIPLPKTNAKYKSEEDAPTFVVDGLFYRRLTYVIRGIAEDKHFAERYHWIPHKAFWQPPSSTRDSPEDGQSSREDSPASTSSQSSSGHSSQRAPPIRIYTDTYNSNAACEEAEKIRNQARNPADGADVEYVMFPIHLWSDATHLTNFGSASLWPIYLYFGALSKYVRGMPTEFAAHHLAYVPTLPDSLQDAYVKAYGTPASADVLRFCKRELMQRIWLLLLDEEFMEAYRNGILVVCGDGVTRRIFPRIMTYSADYPEKILLTTLKPLARCPCPRCLVTQDELSAAGTPEDDERRRANKRIDDAKLQRDIKKARALVFKHGYSLSSKRVKALLDSKSLNPIQNAMLIVLRKSAFSTRLSPFGVNFYDLFAPDLLHEFELGVWKGVFRHLVRLVAAQGDDMLKEFNRRMRHMPTYGRDKIRRFWNDVASRKNVAARDYEDFLICAMPAFEGLLPLKDDETVADLLFELVNWHALAKLRLHTDITLSIFRTATRHMCEAMRAFANTTCTRHKARELEKEAEARVRQVVRKDPEAQPDRKRKIVRFNTLNTFKYHALPYYPDYIERSGTADNYTSQICELEHRHLKRFYARTNKIGYSLQIAKHMRRAALLRALREHDDYVPRRVRLRQQKAELSTPETANTDATDGRVDTALPPTSPLDHHAISATQHLMIKLRSWLVEHGDDPCTKNFIPLLREHLLRRLLDDLALDPEAGFSNAQCNGLEIQGDRIYRHKILRVNYTTYDMRRDQDTINPRTHPDIMMLASPGENDAHPYLYARVIGIFHAQVRYTGPGASRRLRQWQRVEFLWVRWFDLDADYASGFQERRLPRVRFVDATATGTTPFGFVDPSDVLRASHLMPAFAYGTTTDLLGPSGLGRTSCDNNEDYKYYYVGMFVDRDMYMRYLGGGVGHNGVGIDVFGSPEHSSRSRPAGAEALDSDMDSSHSDSSSTSGFDDHDTVGGPGAPPEIEESLQEEAGEVEVAEEASEEGDDYADEQFIRPWDDEDTEGEQDFWEDELEAADHDGNGERADPQQWEDVEALAARLEREEDYYLDDVYAAEGFAPL